MIQETNGVEELDSRSLDPSLKQPNWRCSGMVKIHLDREGRVTARSSGLAKRVQAAMKFHLLGSP
jgi:hypothetical protein